MADEGTLGLSRASREKNDDEPDKEQLQRRMDEARESISQTVMEIKETVTNQYYTVKESVSDALDWRHHFRQHPVAFSVGALSAGLLLGYTLAGSIGGGESNDSSYSGADDDLSRRTAFHGHSYAAQPITDGIPDYEDSQPEQEREEYSADTEHGGSFSYSAASTRDEAPEKPGLFERFKGTSAYDRLQTEVASLGDRFMEELATTAHTVVLPLVFKKLKQLIGVDLSDKEDQQTGQVKATAKTGSDSNVVGGQAASAQASKAPEARAASASSYATSENKGYGGRASTNDSVLDLDR